MGALLWAGTIVGAACGLGHAVYVHKRLSQETPEAALDGANRPKAISYASEIRDTGVHLARRS
jgi:hypothetical protein